MLKILWLSGIMPIQNLRSTCIKLRLRILRPLIKYRFKIIICNLSFCNFSEKEGSQTIHATLTVI